ncbi:MAG: hypothetical protein HZA77_01140 [Candidatus Schekmanbacteria bacterium]|nr:hypothetical protein [Candidatus Schekmanbacteria bacterium]
MNEYKFLTTASRPTPRNAAAPLVRPLAPKGFNMRREERTIPSEEILLKAMELAWKDHHHARDQTWKTVQMVAVLGAGLLTIDLQYKSLLATALAALLVVLASAVGVGITWNHRKLERRKFIHLMNCEELLGLHRDDIIPLACNDDSMKNKSDLVKDSAVSVPKKYKFIDVINPFKQNTSLFILRIHLAIMVFALLIIFLRWRIT